MNNKPVFRRLLMAILIAGLALPGFAGAAVENSFSDDLNGTFSIDQNQTSALVQNGKVSLSGNSFSNQVVSGTVIFTRDPIIEVFLAVNDSKNPPDTRIIYYLSSDEGRTWIQAEPGAWNQFSTAGNRLKWKAVLARQQSGSGSPFIESISLTARSDSELLKRSRDQQRISDLGRVKDALEKFRTDWKTYPQVDAQSDEFRWKQLEQIITRPGFDGINYIFNFPQDPLRTDSKFRWSYDYENIGSDRYVLAAKLEDFNTTYFGKVVLTDDMDGQIDSVNCNDPVYCVGKTSEIFNFGSGSRTQTQSAQTSQTTTTTYRSGYNSPEERQVAAVLANLYGNLPIFGPSTAQTSQTRVTQRSDSEDSQSASLLSKIFSKRPRLVKELQTGNIFEIAIGQRHWIPNQTVFNEYGFDQKKVEPISRTELLVYPRAKLLRVNGDKENRIYYLTEAGYIRPVANMEVFHSYGDRFDDVIEISQTEFLSYPRSKYVAIDPEDITANDSLVRGKVWQIEGNAKKLVAPSAINRLGIQKREIGPVNRTELDYYQELEAIE